MRLFRSPRRVVTLRGKILFLLLIFLSICMLLLFIYNTCYSGTIAQKAKIRANYVAQKAINSAVNSALLKTKYTYNDFVTITRKADQSVASVSANTVNLNKFKSFFTDAVLQTVTDYGREEIEMSVFSMYGYVNTPLNFKIPILVIPIEILSVDFQSKLESRGINQTMHQLNICVKISVKLLLPIGSEEFDVTATVPLAQTVIMGDIPDTYTNVEGVTESESDTILNLAP